MGATEQQIFTRPPDVNFRVRDLAPPNATYIGPADHLYLQTWSSSATEFIITGRLLRSDGTLTLFREAHTPNSDRTLAAQLIQVSEGFLLGVQMSAVATTLTRGQCFATLTIRRSTLSTGAPEMVLCQGYVADGSRLSWPQGVIEHSLARSGNLRWLLGTNPAAGNEISETVPIGARWRVQSVVFSLTTDATVANRVVNIEFSFSGNVFYTANANFTQAASLTETYVASPSGVLQASADNKNFIPLPQDPQLHAEWVINTNTTNLQAGDDFGQPVLLVEEWIEP